MSPIDRGAPQPCPGPPRARSVSKLQRRCLLAIAITLLVLEIRVPPAEDLCQTGPADPGARRSVADYLGHVVSVVDVGIMWANDDNLFRLIGTVSDGLDPGRPAAPARGRFRAVPTASLAAHARDTEAIRSACSACRGDVRRAGAAFDILRWEIRRRPGVLRPNVRRAIHRLDHRLPARAARASRGASSGAFDQPGAGHVRDHRARYPCISCHPVLGSVTKPMEQNGPAPFGWSRCHRVRGKELLEHAPGPKAKRTTCPSGRSRRGVLPTAPRRPNRR